MAYLITCSGSKQNPPIINPSRLQDLSFNNELFEARQEMINLYNQNLDWNRCLPAWQLYTGNRSVLYPHVSQLNWLKPNAEIKILSALFGWINHNDLIPKYNLAMSDRINGLRVWNIWNNYNILPDFFGQTDVDLLSRDYRRAINYNGTTVAKVPNVHWNDNYGHHKGVWLNEQLTVL